MFSGFGNEDALSVEEAVKQAVHRVDPFGIMLALRRRGADGEPGADTGPAMRGEDPYRPLIDAIARRIQEGEFLSPALVQDALRRMDEGDGGGLPDPEDVRELTRQIGAGLGFR